VERYKTEIAKAKMIVWNGPLGVFEMEPFNAGTFAIAKAVAANTGRSLDRWRRRISVGREESQGQR